VGTGVNTSEPPGTLTFNDGGGAVSYTAYDSFACSGIWGTNLCNVTVNPPSPLAIAGDARNFAYNTTYTVQVGGFQDRASATQNQLGDANGPNTMDTKTWTFTTEADTVAPQVQSETPSRGSTGADVATDLTVEIVDKKVYPGNISGTGVDSTTCRFNVTSPSFTLTTFQEGDPEVTVTAIDYGFRFVIDPASDFAQSETVTVTAYDCEDLAANVMVTDTWTFTTADGAAPYVDQAVPADDDVVDNDAVAVFHIKDNGSGVDLDEVVIYVNGVYYTNGGGAGQVTVTGTRITFADSLDFNGGNYAGDTTSVTGTVADYTFTIDPEIDFADGEPIPVIIYAKDASGNAMERVVYAFATETPGGGGVCPAGGGAGGGTIFPEINQSTVKVVQIDDDSVLVAWNTNLLGTTQVFYDLVGHDDLTVPPLYGYEQASPLDEDQSYYHSVVIDGLVAGNLYYFRPVSLMQGRTVFGPELAMAPRFSTIELPCPAPEPEPGTGGVCPAAPACPVCPLLPAVPGLPPGAGAVPGTETGAEAGVPEFILEILSINHLDDFYGISGTASPLTPLSIVIY
jgi:hypothetical protein